MKKVTKQIKKPAKELKAVTPAAGRAQYRKKEGVELKSNGIKTKTPVSMKRKRKETFFSRIASLAKSWSEQGRNLIRQARETREKSRA